MKKNLVKTMVAAVCVVAAGMGGFKAYNAANQSEADMLLAENVEALSSGDGDDGGRQYMTDDEMCNWVMGNMCKSLPGSWCNCSYGSAKCSTFGAFYDSTQCPY